MVLCHQKENDFHEYWQLGTGKQDRGNSGAGVGRVLNAKFITEEMQQNHSSFLEQGNNKENIIE